MKDDDGSAEIETSMALARLSRTTRRERRARSESLLETLAATILGLLVLLAAGSMIPVLLSAFSDDRQVETCDAAMPVAERQACIER